MLFIGIVFSVRLESHNLEMFHPSDSSNELELRLPNDEKPVHLFQLSERIETVVTSSLLNYISQSMQNPT